MSEIKSKEQYFCEWLCRAYPVEFENYQQAWFEGWMNCRERSKAILAASFGKQDSPILREGILDAIRQL